MKKENTSSISMEKSAINFPYYPGIILSFFLLNLGGCSGSKKFLNLKPILLEREAEVNIRYDYDVIKLEAPVIIIDSIPTAFRFSLYQRIRPGELLIERVFFPGEPIQLILPRTLFSSDTLGNLAILDPLGGNYKKLEQLFTLSSVQEQVLFPFVVTLAPYVLKFFVLERMNGDPVAQAKVIVSNGGNILGFGITDSLGFARITIKRVEHPWEFLRVSIRTGGNYPPWSGNVEVSDQTIFEKTIWLGTALAKNNGGVFYKVIEDLTPLREGPENGSPTIFFLNMGDRVYVTKVAGDRLYGSVEVFTDDPNVFIDFSGWILNKFVQVAE